MKKYFVLLFIFLFMPVINVFAVDYSDTECSYESQAYLTKIASKVEAGYEIKQNSDGEDYFVISIYNITKEIYVVINDGSSTNKIIGYEDTTDGVYKFDDDNVSTIETYTITVKSVEFGCYSNFNIISLVKPKKNGYANYYICKYEIMDNYSYCDEWIKSSFTLSSDQIQEEIKKEYNKRNVTTTKCVSCEIKDKNDKAKKDYKNLKIKALITIGIAMIIDAGLIIYFIKRLKNYDLVS